MSSTEYSSIPQIIRLWRHELFRVFADKMTTDEDRMLVKVDYKTFFKYA